MKIRREKIGTDKKSIYSYLDEADKKIKDPKILKYIEGLVIPPAYDRVLINYNYPSEKLAYVGYDSKNRPQYIYADWWIKKAKHSKFCGLISFGKMLPTIQRDINKLIGLAKPTKFKIIALVMRIITLCNFRIGNEKYADLYKSYGVSTIEKRHISFIDDSLHMQFIGKKGVLNECIITDPTTIKEIKALTASKSPNDKVFTYYDGESYVIKPTEINDWLKTYDPTFTSKMFRIFTTNMLIINRMKTSDPRNLTLNERKRHVVDILKGVSCIIHNTPAICRKDYSDSDVVKLYIERPAKWHAAFKGDSRKAFIKFLKKKC